MKEHGGLSHKLLFDDIKNTIQQSPHDILAHLLAKYYPYGIPEHTEAYEHAKALIQHDGKMGETAMFFQVRASEIAASLKTIYALLEEQICEQDLVFTDK